MKIGLELIQVGVLSVLGRVVMEVWRLLMQGFLLHITKSLKDNDNRRLQRSTQLKKAPTTNTTLLVAM